MKRMKIKENKLREAVKESTTMAQVLRTLGFTSLAGGTYTYFNQRIKKLGIDTSHFVGQSWSKGKTTTKRKSPAQILILDLNNYYRPKTYQLKRAMLLSGIPYQCSDCGIREWNSASITLEIDHINEEFRDNRIENLRFLCPNCHSQHQRPYSPTAEAGDLKSLQ